MVIELPAELWYAIIECAFLSELVEPNWPDCAQAARFRLLSHTGHATFGKLVASLPANLRWLTARSQSWMQWRDPGPHGRCRWTDWHTSDTPWTTPPWAEPPLALMPPAVPALEVHLSGVGLSDEGFARLVRGLYSQPFTQVLDVSNNDLGSGDIHGLKHLTTGMVSYNLMPSLRLLRMSQCSFEWSNDLQLESHLELGCLTERNVECARAIEVLTLSERYEALEWDMTYNIWIAVVGNMIETYD